MLFHCVKATVIRHQQGNEQVEVIDADWVISAEGGKSKPSVCFTVCCDIETALYRYPEEAAWTNLPW